MGSWGADSELIVLISPDDHLCVCEGGPEEGEERLNGVSPLV